MKRITAENTKVISFRVPLKVHEVTDREAWKARKRKSHFVEDLFIAALEAHIGKTLPKTADIKAAA